MWSKPQEVKTTGGQSHSSSRFWSLVSLVVYTHSVDAWASHQLLTFELGVLLRGFHLTSRPAVSPRRQHRVGLHGPVSARSDRNGSVFADLLLGFPFFELALVFSTMRFSRSSCSSHRQNKGSTNKVTVTRNSVEEDLFLVHFASLLFLDW